MTELQAIKCDWRIHDQCFKVWTKRPAGDKDARDNLRDEAHMGEGWEVTKEGSDICPPCEYEYTFGQESTELLMTRQEVQDHFEATP